MDSSLEFYPLTELDILSAKQWTISCRLVYKLKVDDVFFTQRVQDATDKLVGHLPSLNGVLELSNKRLRLNTHRVEVKFVNNLEITFLESTYLESNFENNDFLTINNDVFSICVTKIVASDMYILGLRFSHGIVDGHGMYLVANALLNLINDLDYKVDLVDNRNVFYKQFPIHYCNYEKITQELKQKNLNPMYFGSFFGRIMEQIVLYNVRNVGKQVSIPIKRRSNAEMCKQVIEKYIQFYGYPYSDVTIGQVYDARFRLKGLGFENYIGNLSYIYSHPIIEGIEETLEIIKEKISDKELVQNNIYLCENALYNNYYIPNININKQLILVNSHIAFYPLFIPLFGQKLVRLITHNTGDCILFSKENDTADVKCYLSQQYGRGSLENFSKNF